MNKKTQQSYHYYASTPFEWMTAESRVKVERWLKSRKHTGVGDVSILGEHCLVRVPLPPKAKYIIESRYPVVKGCEVLSVSDNFNKITNYDVFAEHHLKMQEKAQAEEETQEEGGNPALGLGAEGEANRRKKIDDDFAKLQAGFDKEEAKQ